MKALSQEERRRKLRELAADGGHASVEDMLHAEWRRGSRKSGSLPMPI
jgi:hypothetical protein